MRRHLVSAALGTGEHEHALERRVSEQFRQKSALAAGFHEHDALVDALDSGRRRSYGDLQRVLVEQVVGQLLDVRRHGGREEQVLTLLGQVANDTTDRIDEAHVEHLVGFVEDEDLGLREIGITLAEVVEQAARGGDDDVDATRQRLALRAMPHAAEDRGDAEAKLRAVRLEVVSDLRREFARRRKHEHAAAALGRRFPVGG